MQLGILCVQTANLVPSVGPKGPSFLIALMWQMSPHLEEAPGYKRLGFLDT